MDLRVSRYPLLVIRCVIEPNDSLVTNIVRCFGIIAGICVCVCKNRTWKGKVDQTSVIYGAKHDVHEKLRILGSREQGPSTVNPTNQFLVLPLKRMMRCLGFRRIGLQSQPHASEFRSPKAFIKKFEICWAQSVPQASLEELVRVRHGYTEHEICLPVSGITALGIWDEALLQQVLD